MATNTLLCHVLVRILKMSEPWSSPPESQPMVCYRHTDRHVGVTCQRCNRPICPECMRPASVGYQCPECTKGASSKVITSRDLKSQAQSATRATKVLIALNVIVFIAMVAESQQANQAAGWVYVNGALRGPLVSEGEWWRIFTSGFIHSGIFHIGMNMYLLWLLGQVLEPVMGTVRFVALYFISLVGGSMGVLLLSFESPTVGASGAVFGLMGAMLVIQWRNNINPWQSGIGGLVAINLVLTFVLPRISIGGHLGGVITGAIVAYVMIELASNKLRR